MFSGLNTVINSFLKNWRESFNLGISIRCITFGFVTIYFKNIENLNEC